MSAKKLSIRGACALLGLALSLSAAASTLALYALTGSILAALCGLSFCALVAICALCFVALVRRRLTLFSDLLCRTLDAMLSGNPEPPQLSVEENLFHKVAHRLCRLYEAMNESRRDVARERASLQELISDISHQVKTPLANLKMINSTLLEQAVPAQKQREFLAAQAGQLDKLEFLMEALIQTSRLETGVIALEKRMQSIYDTLAAALGGVLLRAEGKRIAVQVHCPEHLEVPHDRKWTAEALFNILDNAVKYTPERGKIRVTVESWELYLKISISDTGRGIPEKHHGMVFKRFYREEDVHDVEGVGIGLYLAREIIAMQGGYIQLSSSPGAGSCFAVFLPRD